VGAERNVSESAQVVSAISNNWTEDSEMTSANQTFRQAANSPVGRQAAETAKSIGEEVSDLAGDVGRMAARYARPGYGRRCIR
jgi:hypothetical protein